MQKKLKKKIKKENKGLLEDIEKFYKKVDTEYEIKIGCGEPGLFKSETKWASLKEFVGLRPKQYSFNTENMKKSLKAKGIGKKSIKKGYITHKQMVDQVLKDEAEVGCKMDHFVSKKCDIYLEYVYKRALINYEDKRYWLDSVYSLPYGHPWIEEYIGGKVTLNEIIKRIKGNDSYEYELNANKFDKIKKEIQDMETKKIKDISYGIIDKEAIRLLDKKCHTNITQDDLIAITNNDKAKALLQSFNDDDDSWIDF